MPNKKPAGRKAVHHPEIAAIEFGRVTIDSPLRMIFNSSKDPSSIHLVDLEERKGSGVCTCQNYEFTINPAINSGRVKINTPAAWCKHIQAARQIVTTKAIQQLADYLRGNRKTRTLEDDER